MRWRAALASSALLAMPIPQGPQPSAPSFIGHPATQSPVFTQLPPQNPFMAPNERGELHVDAWQTDANALPGPLGRQMQVVSTAQFADCGSITFDSRGRIVTVCVALSGPTLIMFDSKTLATLTR